MLKSQVYAFAMSHHPVRSDGNLKRRLFLNKKMRYLRKTRKGSPQPEGLFFASVRKLFKDNHSI